jgi:hypothetical protein
MGLPQPDLALLSGLSCCIAPSVGVWCDKEIFHRGIRHPGVLPMCFFSWLAIVLRERRIAVRAASCEAREERPLGFGLAPSGAAAWYWLAVLKFPWRAPQVKVGGRVPEARRPSNSGGSDHLLIMWCGVVKFFPTGLGGEGKKQRNSTCIYKFRVWWGSGFGAWGRFLEDGKTSMEQVRPTHLHFFSLCLFCIFQII